MLRREHRHIERVEAQARADGFVSRHERRELLDLLDRADERIRQARHDADVRRRG